jgi:hypothetical protein
MLSAFVQVVELLFLWRHESRRHNLEFLQLLFLLLTSHLRESSSFVVIRSLSPMKIKVPHL